MTPSVVLAAILGVLVGRSSRLWRETGWFVESANRMRSAILAALEHVDVLEAENRELREQLEKATEDRPALR